MTAPKTVYDMALYLAQHGGGEVDDYLAEAAQLLGKWHLPTVAELLGGEVSGDRWVRAPSPGRPADDRTLVVRFDDNGGYYVYAHDGRRSLVKAHVAGSLQEVAPAAPSPEEVAKRKARALGIWGETIPIRGTLGEAYLHARGLVPPPDAEEVLRWHPRCPWGRAGGTRPCMVALLRDVVTDQPVAIHRTSIEPKERMTLGPRKGAAVKLWPAPVEGRLMIGEGIETSLAATLLDDPRSSPPAWAMTSADGIKNMPILDTVRQLTILIDNDAHGVGQRAADHCAWRWERAGRSRPIRLKPTALGEDFNDVLLKRRGGNGE